MTQATNPAPAGDKNDGGGKSGDKATIGNSIKVTGDISGKEDLIINGSVEGTIDFHENNILIGEKGHVNANVIAKNIQVEGEIKGELRASEQVTIKPSGRVLGDIRAPRVILNDGCQFKGSVDMEAKQVDSDPRGTGAAKLPGAKPPLVRPTPPKL